MVMTTIKTKMNHAEEEYPSGLIEDQLEELTKNNPIAKLGLEINHVAPNFELQSPTGEAIQLSDYRGKTVFLNFWASWCGPCITEMPIMESYYEQYKDDDNVEILAVNMTSQERRKKSVNEFISKHELTFPIVLDEQGEVERLYKVLGYPTTYIIDEDGIIVDGFTGPIKKADDIKEIIDRVR